jgi:hypothetical protein
MSIHDLGGPTSAGCLMWCGKCPDGGCKERAEPEPIIEAAVVDIPPGPTPWMVRAEAAEAKVRAVRMLHQVDDTGKACDGCGLSYPCKTRRLLDGRRS